MTRHEAQPDNVEEKQSPRIPAGEHRRGEDDEPMLHCPVCSKKLLARKCKLYCDRCGYYMSCADYI